MRAAAATIALIAFAFASAAPAEERDAIDSEIRSCERRLDPELDVGFERIAERCPGLVEALERSDLSAWLPDSWRDPGNDLSAGGLAELRRLIERERSAGALREAPPTSRLSPVLAELGGSGEERASLWARFRAWLRTVFDEREARARESWLDRWLRELDPSEAVMRAVSYVSLGLVVALAVLILWNELREAGLLRPGARRRETQGRTPDARASALGWSDVEAAPLLERPGLLLQLLLAALVRQHRLAPLPGLTVHELASRARWPGATDRERYGTLAAVAERARFAGRPPEPAALEAAVADGRALLEALERTRESPA